MRQPLLTHVRVSPRAVGLVVGIVEVAVRAPGACVTAMAAGCADRLLRRRGGDGRRSACQSRRLRGQRAGSGRPVVASAARSLAGVVVDLGGVAITLVLLHRRTMNVVDAAMKTTHR
jgi:hypothetical protein